MGERDHPAGHFPLYLAVVRVPRASVGKIQLWQSTINSPFHQPSADFLTTYARYATAVGQPLPFVRTSPRLGAPRQLAPKGEGLRLAVQSERGYVRRTSRSALDRQVVLYPYPGTGIGRVAATGLGGTVALVSSVCCP